MGGGSAYVMTFYAQGRHSLIDSIQGIFCELSIFTFFMRAGDLTYLSQFPTWREGC